MTGAAIVRWREGDAVVLAVHGAFDGASAWALRLEMEGACERSFVIDLTHTIEACEFAAGLLATWARQHWREKTLRFIPGDAHHARLLAGFGLELADDPAEVLPLELVESYGDDADARPRPGEAPLAATPA